MDLKYPGNKQFNVYTKLTKERKEARISALEQARDGKPRVTYDVWEANKYPRCRSETSRLCSDNIALLKDHLASFKGSHEKTGRRKCVVCQQMLLKVYVVSRRTSTVFEGGQTGE